MWYSLYTQIVNLLMEPSQHSPGGCALSSYDNPHSFSASDWNKPAVLSQHSMKLIHWHQFHLLFSIFLPHKWIHSSSSLEIAEWTVMNSPSGRKVITCNRLWFFVAMVTNYSAARFLVMVYLAWIAGTAHWLVLQVMIEQLGTKSCLLLCVVESESR